MVMGTRSHPLYQWLMPIVLLINGTVTASAWASNLPETGTAQVGETHVHCADAMRGAAGSGDLGAAQSAPKHQHSSTDGCCTPGACHCASSSAPGNVSLIPIRAPLLRVASIATRDQGALPAPALTRHFRPPIR